MLMMSKSKVITNPAIGRVAAIAMIAATRRWFRSDLSSTELAQAQAFLAKRQNSTTAAMIAVVGPM